jgi:hypothetical protein
MLLTIVLLACLQVEVRYLVKAVVEAAWYQGRYQVQEVQGTYSTEAWSGAISEEPRFSVDSTDVQVVLADQSQPLPYSPAFTGTWRFLVGFCMFPILTPLITVTLRVFLQIWVRAAFQTDGSSGTMNPTTWRTLRPHNNHIFALPFACSLGHVSSL